MASEITVTIWADTPADYSLAHRLGEEVAASVQRSTGLYAEAVVATSRPVEPRDVAEAAALASEPAPDLPRITSEDGVHIEANGAKMVKLPHPVYLVELGFEAVVETNEGALRAHPGDYVAYDPISGHVWPVSASYVEQHYVDADEPDAKVGAPPA